MREHIIFIGHGDNALIPISDRTYFAFGCVSIITSIFFEWKINVLIVKKFNIVGGIIALIVIAILMYS